jgi:uncharacterized protein (DUF4415 family)
MKEKNTLHTYNTEDHDDAPIWSDDDFANAVHRVGLKPVGKKLKINLTLDPDVVSWYKARAGGRGYQTLMNAALREGMRGFETAEILRQVIREELHTE